MNQEPKKKRTGQKQKRETVDIVHPSYQPSAAELRGGFADRRHLRPADRRTSQGSKGQLHQVTQERAPVSRSAPALSYIIPKQKGEAPP